MGQKVIQGYGDFLPTEKQMQAINDNMDELYAASAAVGDGTGNSLDLAEHANNTAAVTAGLAVGDLYTTTGTVKVVTT